MKPESKRFIAVAVAVAAAAGFETCASAFMLTGGHALSACIFGAFAGWMWRLSFDL